MQTNIDKMRTARDAAKREIATKFRNYANLVEPPPPTVENIREQLRDDEAVVSFYFGRDNSFVWAAGKAGPVPSPPRRALGRDQHQDAKLREALEPKAAMISDIPPFDVELALRTL